MGGTAPTGTCTITRSFVVSVPDWLEKPWRDGTTAVVLAPFDLIARLCALVPPPRFHLTRYHGVLSAHANARSEVVPSFLGDGSPQLSLPAICTRRVQDSEPTSNLRKPTRKKWAELLARVFRVDVTVCPACRGTMSIGRFVTDPNEAERLIALNP